MCAKTVYEIQPVFKLGIFNGIYFNDMNFLRLIKILCISFST